MKGNNMIEMNQATIIEAVQEYLDARWKGAEQKVTAVKVANNTGDLNCLSFDVHISEVEDKS